MPTEAQKRAAKKYHEKQVGITIRVSPMQKEFIKQAAESLNESVKDYLVNAANDYIRRIK